MAKRKKIPPKGGEDGTEKLFSVVVWLAVPVNMLASVVIEFPITARNAEEAIEIAVSNLRKYLYNEETQKYTMVNGTIEVLHWQTCATKYPDYLAALIYEQMGSDNEVSDLPQEFPKEIRGKVLQLFPNKPPTPSNPSDGGT